MRIKDQLRQPERRKKVDGHDLTAPERYAPDTRHMVILDVRKEYTGYNPGGRVRLFLSDEGYSEIIQADGRGDIKIIIHLRVRAGELEHYTPERGE